MTKRRFPTHPAYEQSLEGLRELHRLTTIGATRGPQMDAVRVRLEKPWYEMTETEQERVDGLSEDLYSISDTPYDVLPMSPEAEQGLHEAQIADVQGDWDKALNLFREWGRYLTPARLSFDRGRIWQQAGDPATAALFFGHAARLEPSDGSYASLYLYSLSKSNEAAADLLAQEILVGKVDVSHVHSK